MSRQVEDGDMYSNLLYRLYKYPPNATIRRIWCRNKALRP